MPAFHSAHPHIPNNQNRDLSQPNHKNEDALPSGPADLNYLQNSDQYITTMPKNSKLLLSKHGSNLLYPLH